MDLGQFFAADYQGGAFVLFGPAHIAALLSILLLNLYLARFRQAAEASRRRIRWILAGSIWTAESAWHIWNLATQQWSVRYLLPLHLCSAMIWLSGLMLISGNYRLYEFVYFLGIGGAIQYLATPDLGIYGFPHFRFFQTFLSHGLMLTSAVYMTVVEGLRPTWRSTLRVAFWANIYALTIFMVNRALGSNYLMINAKPDVPSLLDFLPPWPYYIIYMEVIGATTILLLYLPFARRDFCRHVVQ
jgi:hypothetical integral membrane protein (TIGR02206 family)